jgi:hypothetical protein
MNDIGGLLSGGPSLCVLDMQWRGGDLIITATDEPASGRVYATLVIPKATIVGDDVYEAVPMEARPYILSFDTDFEEGMYVFNFEGREMFVRSQADAVWEVHS